MGFNLPGLWQKVLDRPTRLALNEIVQSTQVLANQDMPVNAIIMFIDQASCPPGYIRDDRFAGFFPQGLAVNTFPTGTGVAASGSHTHSVPALTEPSVTSNVVLNLTSIQQGTGASINVGTSVTNNAVATGPTGTGTTGAATPTPALIGVLF